MIRQGFWQTVLAIAIGVLLGVYAAAWLDGQDNTPEALELSGAEVVAPFGPPVEGHGAARSQSDKPVDASILKGKRLKGSIQHARSVTRPNPDLTPGIARDLTRKQICETTWSADRRHVTLAMRKQVFADYSLPYETRARYEVDHLIPRELGGADDVQNLWPQPWIGPYNAHDKDRLENHLRRLVCAGAITLEFAQEAIASDWIAAFRLYVPAGR